MTDTPKGETVVVNAPKNDATATPAPVVPVVPTTPPVEDKSAVEGEVAKLRKENEQITMRANQLTNENEAIKKAEADRKAKELEQQNEFKTLYEQEKEKREEAERLREEETLSAEIKAKTTEVLADYSDSVKELTKEAGLVLADTDDATIEAFKAKLDKFQGMVGTAKVTPNNPSAPSGTKVSIENAEGIVEKPLTGARFDEYAKGMPGIASMMVEREE